VSVAVRCKNVKKTYGEGEAAIYALRGVDLEIQKGEFLLLMGPSGSGKTTLISVIAGILTQTEGECSVFDLEFNLMNDLEKTKYRGSHIGFVFQAFNLVPMLTNAENVAIPLLLIGTPKKEALLQAKKVLEEVGIGDRADSYPNTLSGGQQQRVAIARAIVHNPDLIVCDEPTSNLDHETGNKVMELLRLIVDQQGKTMIIVTHDPRITGFAHRIAHMEDGRIVT
jgi:putative ABC transport system ATP-binding protein